jgi:hypothetical protein
METVPASQDLQPLRKWLHDLNNRVGTILSTTELMQMEVLSPQAEKRRQIIEEKTLEAGEIIRAIADHYLSVISGAPRR